MTTLKQLKPLIKIASQRTRVPVLNSIMVKDGMAYASDMQIQLSTAYDLPDGCYNAKKLAYALEYNEKPEADYACSDFPLMTCKPDDSWSLDIAKIRAVAPFLSQEETRYYLTGVMIEKHASGFCYTATDGHRLAHFGDMKEETTRELIIRAAAVKLICELQKKNMEGLFLVSNDHIKVTLGEYTLISKNVDGTYPPYRRVIPTRNTIEHELSVKDTIALCKKELARAKADKSKAAIVRIAAQGLTVGVQAGYLLDCMPANQDKVQIILEDESAPILFKNSVAECVVLMPMRVT